MSKYSTFSNMNENIKFFIDELYGKIPNWEGYDFKEIEELIEIILEYPEKFPEDYEDKFKEIKDEFDRKTKGFE